MKIIICTFNPDLIPVWEQIINKSDFRQSPLKCSKELSLKDIIKDMGHDENFLILYHMKSDPNEEKALYKFLEQYPVADKMLVLVNTPDTDQGIRLLHAGVHGYANARINETKLLTALDVIHQGEIWAGEQILLKLLQKTPITSTNYRRDKNLNEYLSNREKQIVDLVIRGKTNREIAEQLNITERTVKAHMSTVFKKTGTRNRLEMTVKLQSL